MPRITITESGKSPQPYRLKIDRESTKIGRSSENDIILKDGSASTYHCVMKRVEGGFILKDTNSTNGIRLEDTRYAIIDLEDEMVVNLGDDIELTFELSDEEKEVLEDEFFEPQQKVMFPKSKKSADDDEEDEEDEKPKKKKPVSLDEEGSDKDGKNKESKPKPKATPRSSRSAAPARPVASAKSTSPFKFLIFFILALVFVVAGLAIRHYQEHGTFIFSQ